MYDSKIAKETPLNRFHRKAIEESKIVAYLKKTGQWDALATEFKMVERYEEVFKELDNEDYDWASTPLAE